MFIIIFNTELILFGGGCAGSSCGTGLFIAEWRFSQVGVSRGYSLAVVHRLLVVVVSLVLEHGL